MAMDDPAAAMKRLDRNPYVFLIGCPRSGTTLLQRMLDSHPLLAVSNDTHFIPKMLDGFEPGSDPDLTPELIDRTCNYRRIRRMGLSDEAKRAAVSKANTFSELASEFFVQFGKARGKVLAGDKTPDYVKHIPLLHCSFPWAKFVHIIRDGRDTALSTLEWAKRGVGPSHFDLWQDEPVAVCALWWARFVEMGRRDGPRVCASQYKEVRLEDLVARPEAELQRIARFLEIPFAPAMLTYHEGKTRHEPQISSKKRWLPPTAGLRDWRTDMAPRDVELFEALAGDLLSDLGYDRTTKVISNEITKVAEQCRAWWQGEMARRAQKSAARRRRS
jgi:hypothetical protein